MHPALLLAYGTMLPRLQAQEQLLAIEAAAIGSGSAKPEAAKRALANLRHAADPGRLGRQAARPRSSADLARALRGSGIGLRRAARASEGPTPVPEG